MPVDDITYLTHYPGSFWITLMQLGPLGACALLAMLTCLGLASFRAFSATGNTLLAALPLALGIGSSLQISYQLVPYINKAVHRISDLDLDTGILRAIAEIRALLILGFLFSFLTVLAILLRHRRKATAV